MSIGDWSRPGRRVVLMVACTLFCANAAAVPASNRQVKSIFFIEMLLDDKNIILLFIRGVHL
jgi:hypothetical protein